MTNKHLQQLKSFASNALVSLYLFKTHALLLDFTEQLYIETDAELETLKDIVSPCNITTITDQEHYDKHVILANKNHFIKCEDTTAYVAKCRNNVVQYFTKGVGRRHKAN